VVVEYKGAISMIEQNIWWS